MRAFFSIDCVENKTKAGSMSEESADKNKYGGKREKKTCEEKKRKKALGRKEEEKGLGEQMRQKL